MIKNRDMLDEIMGMLRTVIDDREKLERIHEFFIEEIYDEPVDNEIVYNVEIPEKYKKIVPGIADSLNAGMICFLNTDTLEVEDLPESLVMDPDDYESMTGETMEDMDIRHQNWENYIEITPPESHEAYNYMEGFAETLSKVSFKRKVFHALKRKSPFGHFKYIVEGSDYRQKWFDYRQARLEEYVLRFLDYEG